MANFFNNSNNMMMLNKISFYMFILMSAAVLYLHFRHKSTVCRGEMPIAMYGILLSVVAVMGIAVRVYQFGSVPAGFNYDEAMAAVDANAIAAHGTDHLGMSLPVFFQSWKTAQMGALMIYLIAPLIKLFGISITVVRIPIFICSILGGCFAVMLVKDTFGRRASVLAAVIIAISPWHIMQSRWALEANTLPHFFIAGLYFLNKGINGKKRYLYAASAIFGVSMYCYGLAVYIVALFLIMFMVYALISKKADIKTVLISGGIYLTIFLPMLLCLIINLLELDTLKLGSITIPRLYETTRRGDMIFFSSDPMNSLKNNIQSFYEVVLTQKTGIISNMFGEFGLFYKFALPLVIPGIVYVCIQKNKAVKAVFILPIISLLICAIITSAEAPWRIATLYYFIEIFAALGMWFAITELKWLSIPGGISFLLAFVMFCSQYFTSYKEQTIRYFFAGFGEALEYMNTIDADKYYITSNSRVETSADVSEIYALFYHNIDSEYFNGKTNEQNNKTYLPYKDRYIYSIISAEDIKPSENAVYLVASEQKGLFDEDKYSFREFFGLQTNYYVITKN